MSNSSSDSIPVEELLAKFVSLNLIIVIDFKAYCYSIRKVWVTANLRVCSVANILSSRNQTNTQFYMVLMHSIALIKKNKTNHISNE